MDAFEKLKETKQLFDAGIINEEEYQTIKTRLLDEMVSESPKKAESHVAPQTQTKMEAEKAVIFPSTPAAKIEPVSYAPTVEGASTGMKVLSFLFPIVGLILFLLDREKKPDAARDELKWAGIGFGLGLIGYFLLMAMSSIYY